MIKEVLSEIHKILDEISSKDLVLDINYPLQTGNKICWSNNTCLSAYFDIDDIYTLYKKFVKNREFTLLFKDGSLIQIFYEFDKKEIVKHRLFYLNFTVIEAIKKNENEDEFKFDYNEPLLDQIELLYEHTENNITYLNTKLLQNIGFLRFDYDKESSIEIEHPASHLTINQEGVRIPVEKPLTPYEFFDFILLHYKNYKLQDSKKKIFFNDTILDNERKMIHVGKDK